MTNASEWDARFRSGGHSELTPDPFLVFSEIFFDLLPGRGAALDLACGAGRHAVWLAERGFQVTAIDFSSEALARTHSLAQQHGQAVDCRQLDLESPGVELGEEAYDLICGFFFLHRPLFPALRRALKNAGLLIYKTYSVDQLRYPGRPRHPMHLLEHNELLRMAADFRILHYEERWAPAGTEAIVAQKGGCRQATPGQTSKRDG
jgi:tellurite methyltransferase